MIRPFTDLKNNSCSLRDQARNWPPPVEICPLPPGTGMAPLPSNEKAGDLGRRYAQKPVQLAETSMADIAFYSGAV